MHGSPKTWIVCLVVAVAAIVAVGAWASAPDGWQTRDPNAGVKVSVDQGAVTIVTYDPDVDVNVIDDGGSIHIVDRKTGEEIHLNADNFALRLGEGTTRLRFSGQKLELTRAGQTIVTVKRGRSDEKEKPDGSRTHPTGTLTGTVRLRGEIPELPPLVQKGADVKDAKVCSDKAIPDESLLVDPETRGVANVFVYLGSAPDGHTNSSRPKEPVEFRSERCRFVPHAMIVRTEQPIRLKNAMPIVGNVHTVPRRNAQRNQILPPKKAEGVLRYTRPEFEPVRVASDFHRWMSAWHLPLAHPFGAVTGSKGRFRIEDLPPGEHSFRVWHERAKDRFLERDLEVRIRAGQTTNTTIPYPETALSE